MVTLVITCSRGQVRVDVHDTSRALPEAADVSADAETGRGLHLVATLSDECGFCRTPAGKAVYFMLAFPRWRKSSLSLANGNCVEVAGPHPDGIGVRDSTDPAGPVLRFPPDEWRAFLNRLQKR